MGINYLKKHGVKSAEELGLVLVFQERRTRGTNDILYVASATDIDSPGTEVNDFVDAGSWEELKRQYPTIEDILYELGLSEHWVCNNSEMNRILYVDKCSGHEGLYDDAPNASVLLSDNDD